MQHITMLVGINDDGDENNDVLFENRDVVSSLVVETVVTTITSWALEILFGALSHFQPFTFTAGPWRYCLVAS